MCIYDMYLYVYVYIYIWHYLSNATCQIRPHVCSTALFVIVVEYGSLNLLHYSPLLNKNMC